MGVVSSTPTLAARGRRKGLRRSAQRRREALAGYAFVAPSTIGVAVFVLVPMVLAFVLSFTDTNGFGQSHFVGLENYRRMFSDPLFVKSVKVTLLYVVVFVPGIYVIGLGMALLVHGALPARAFFRAAFFAPYTVSLVVVALIWRYMLADKVGIVSRALAQVGVSAPSFLGDPNVALWVVAFVSIWFFVGYYMVILLGGLQEIPTELIEAARLDGAGPFRMLFNIVLPMLKPTTFFVLVLSAIAGLAGLQSFDLIYVMTQGGPANSTSLGIFYIYQQAFSDSAVGYATAMASFYAIMLVFLAGIAFKLTKGGRFDFGER
jgi:multiple sugar transport system permease protein